MDPEVPTQPPDRVPSLGMAVAATSAHALFALVFYLLAAGFEELHAAALRVLLVTVALTGSLAFAYGFATRGGSVARRSRVIGIIRAVTPWVIAPVATSWLAPPTPAGWPDAQRALVIFALGVSSLLVAQLARRHLPHLAAISRKRANHPPIDLDDSSLAGGLARLLAGLSFVSIAVAVGVMNFRPGVGFTVPALFEPGIALVLSLFGVSLTLAAFAGVSVGRSPGRDVRSIARRLDALGYDSTAAINWPVAVTSADDLGRLFLELERLRRRLANEVQRYQDALDRTRHADTAKANFLAAVSHELRTPLNSIEGYAQLLLEGVPAPLTEAQAEDVRLIRAGARQLLGLINDILDISMIESGELSLSFGSHDLGALIREVVAIHQPLVRVDDKSLVADVPEDLPKVVCDRRRIGQVLNNLVSNAIKFTERGSITVRAVLDVNDQSISMHVIDTGVGISSDELDTIFEEFRQVGELKRRVKGTGLGLAIARSIAEHHGGSLRASSEPNVGSTFTLTLPIRLEDIPEKIDVTEARVLAAQRARRRTGRIPVYVEPTETPYPSQSVSSMTFDEETLG